MPSPTATPESIDIAIVGCGAAGLMAAIFAGRAAASARIRRRIVAFDGAKSLGAKILIAGGGRCNVTHHAVSERDFHGSTPAAIRKVLRRFGVDETRRFFESYGVDLKREETGKLFPVADDARVVLEALLAAAASAGVELRHPCRVHSIERSPTDTPPATAPTPPPTTAPPTEPDPSSTIPRHRFLLGTERGPVHADRVILATGGCSLPRTGSDGAGLAIAKRLGHTLTPLVVPALVPLLLPEGHWVRELSGVASEVRFTLRSGGGRVLQRVEGRTLCTHFGLSGPAALDISRCVAHARHDDPTTTLELSWLPTATLDSIDAALLATGRHGVLAWLRERLPERLARALLALHELDPALSVQQWPRERRRGFASDLVAMPLPIDGDRGFAYAEVTAGGVPLAEIDLGTMESRLVPGLHLCGEICDVDGRIGGFNFQWAWASGFVAGTAAAG